MGDVSDLGRCTMQLEKRTESLHLVCCCFVAYRLHKRETSIAFASGAHRFKETLNGSGRKWQDETGNKRKKNVTH